MNSAQDACDFIEEVLPAADHVQLRLTGVFFDEKAERWVASDSHPIPEAVYELYAFVLEVAFDKVDAVFVRQQRHVRRASTRAARFKRCARLRKESARSCDVTQPVERRGEPPA